MKHALIVIALWLMAGQTAYCQATNKADEFLLKESTRAAAKRTPGAVNSYTDKSAAQGLIAKADPSSAATKAPSAMEPSAVTKSEITAPQKSSNMVTQAPAKTSGIAQKLQSVKSHTHTLQQTTQVLDANTKALMANTEAIRANSEALAANVRAMHANRHLRSEQAAVAAANQPAKMPVPPTNNMRQPAPAAPVSAPAKTYDRATTGYASAPAKVPALPAPAKAIEKAPAPVAAATAKTPAPSPLTPKVEKQQLPVAAAPAKVAPAPMPVAAKTPATAAPVVTPASAPAKLSSLPLAATKAPAAAPVMMAAAPAKMPNKPMGLREKIEVSWNGKPEIIPAAKPMAAAPMPTAAPKIKAPAIADVLANPVVKPGKKMQLNDLMLALNKASRNTTVRKKGLREGDVITTHGFLRVVSTEDSGTAKESYLLQLTLGSQSADSCFLVKISADDLADENVKETAAHAKLFIRQLVKGRVPCIGGHIMRKPVFVTVTGELKYDAVSAAAMKGTNPTYPGKRNLQSYTAWGITQLSNIEFMTL